MREPKILGISLAIPLYRMRDYVYRLKEINNLRKYTDIFSNMNGNFKPCAAILPLNDKQADKSRL